MRLIAASAVIWGHAYALAPHPGIREPIGTFLQFDYSGSLAVEFFFFLSGIFVTNSWISNPSPLRFITSRVFRIAPGLMLSAVFCLFVVGPIFSDIPATEYFSRHNVFAHVLLHSYAEYSIPDLFTHNAIGLANGAIWTIPYEAAMYAALLALGMIGILRNKLISSLLFMAIIIESLAFPENIAFIGLKDVNFAGHLPAFFAFGSLLAIHKDLVEIDGKTVSGLAILTGLFYFGPAFKYALYAAFPIALLWAMTLSLAKLLKLPGDFSYGVYIFGWPIQQCLAQLMPHSVMYAHQVLTLALSLLCAAFSWYFVEKPCIALGRRAVAAIGSHTAQRVARPDSGASVAGLHADDISSVITNGVYVAIARHCRRPKCRIPNQVHGRCT